MQWRNGASVVRAYIQQAESMETTRWRSTEIRWINQQMQRRAVPKWPVGDRCGLSNAPTASRDSLPARPEFRSPAKSSELLINLPANRGRRGKQERDGVAFENESDFASRRFSSSSHRCLLSCGLQHHPWLSTGTGIKPVLQRRSRDIPSIAWSTSEDKPDRWVSYGQYVVHQIVLALSLGDQSIHDRELLACCWLASNQPRNHRSRPQLRFGDTDTSTDSTHST